MRKIWLFSFVLFLNASCEPDDALGRPARAMIAIVTLVVGGLVGSLGIVALIAKGYTALSVGFAVVYIIPICTLGVMKIINKS